MSDKHVAKQRLVIDASTAMSAGTTTTAHPTGQRCRQFLRSVYTICHRAVFTAELRAEWDKHQSPFGMLWRKQMHEVGKIVTVEVPDKSTLAEAIGAIANARTRFERAKDRHLIEAALMADGIVISGDNKSRNGFTELSRQQAEIRRVLWLNPAKADDALEGWLKSGCPDASAHRLGSLKG